MFALNPASARIVPANPTWILEINGQLLLNPER
jgi:hypothetical protein